MDFTRSASGIPQGTRPAGQETNVSAGTKHSANNSGGFHSLGSWGKIGALALLFGCTLLVVALAFLIAFSGRNESKLIDSSRYQAVFLNNNSTSGQSVYFGHITKLNSQYLVLQDIYYLSTPSSSSSSSSNSYSLTKLGCQQLHDPFDQMVINQSDVAFWENLHNGGKVVSAINQFQKSNPNGPNCNQTSTSVGTSSTTTQNTSGSPAPSSSTTSPSTSTTTKKP